MSDDEPKMKSTGFQDRVKAQLKFFAVLVLVLSVLYSIYGGFEDESFTQDPATPPAATPTKPTTVQPTRPAPTSQHEPVGSSEIRAQLQPLRYTTLSAEIPARIERFKYREGEKFKRGDPLIVLDCVFQKAQLIKARAAKDAAERTYQANKSLYDLDAVGKIELENTFSEFEKARSEHISIANTVEKCVVLAPFDGKVAEQKAREEQYAQPGQPLLEVLDASDMELEFLVPSKWLVWLNNRTPVTIHIDETNKNYLATIRSIGAKTDAVSQSVKIVAVIHGDNQELSPGMSGRVKIDRPKSTQ